MIGVELCPTCKENVRKAKAARRAKRLARSLPRRKAEAVTKAERGAARIEMHSAVWAENLRLTVDPCAPFGRCDCGCGATFCSSADGECDHWIERSQGGADTRENGWRLLSRCHRRKTNNEPDRVWWNVKRSDYCKRAGIPFVNRRAR